MHAAPLEHSSIWGPPRAGQVRLSDPFPKTRRVPSETQHKHPFGTFSNTPVWNFLKSTSVGTILNVRQTRATATYLQKEQIRRNNSKYSEGTIPILTWSLTYIQHNCECDKQGAKQPRHLMRFSLYGSGSFRVQIQQPGT